VKEAAVRYTAFDWALRLTTIAAGVVLLLLLWGWARPFVAVAEKQCPAGSHAVWASSLSQALCGDSFTGGVKAK
jgi:hypothetical protein